MDGKGRWIDNVFIERLWRLVKYEDVFLRAYESLAEARRGLTANFSLYDGVRPHQRLEYRTPDAVYFTALAAPKGGLRKLIFEHGFAAAGRRRVRRTRP